jgi:hypothetical protein
MPMTKRIMKGVQDIKTISGRVDDKSIPYKSYMKLSVLEMEKYRRGKEKESALERVRNIDQRFRGIEAEKQEIISSLEARETHRRPISGLGGPEAAPRTTTGPFKIRY